MTNLISYDDLFVIIINTSIIINFRVDIRDTFASAVYIIPLNLTKRN